MLEKISQRIKKIFTTPSELLLLCSCCGILLCFLLLFAPVFYRDSVGYFAVTKAFQLKNWGMAFDLTIIPGLFLLASPLMYLGFNEMQSLTIISSFFGTILIFPAYGILRCYLKDKYAAWGAAAFFFLPHVIKTSFAPLTDSARWFFFLLCWYLILLFLRKRKWWCLFFLGMSYAGFSYVRSEGIVFVGLFSVWFLFELWRESRSKMNLCKFGKMILTVIFPVLLMFLLLSPRMIQCCKETGYPSLDLRQTWAIQGVLCKIIPQSTINPVVKNESEDGTKSYGNSAEYVSEIYTGNFQKRYWKNVFFGGFIPYIIFSLFGACFIIQSRKWQYKHSLFLTFIAVNAAVYLVMRSCAGRYFYIHAFLLIPFAVYGLRICFLCAHKHLPKKLYSQIAIFLPFSFVILILVFVVLGLDNMTPGRLKYYPVIGNYMQKQSCMIKTRSGLPHPVYLIIGKNYGWGFHCKGNEIFYAKGKHVNSKFTVEQILKDGIPVQYCHYACDSLGDVTVLKPDYLIISEAKTKVNLSDEAWKSLRQVDIPHGSKGVMVYQIQTKD